MKFYTVKGNNYECGFQIGRLLRDGVKYSLKIHKISDIYIRKVLKRLEKLNARYKKKYPNYMEELRGITDGAVQDYWKILLLNCPEFRHSKRQHGCTGLALNKNNELIVAHNEDGDPDERKKDCAIIKFIQKNTIFTSFVYPGEIPGSAYNWNFHHFYFVVNYLKPINEDPSKFSKYFTARALTEAKSIPQALEILKKSEDASGYHYYMGKGKEIYSVEQFHDSLGIKEIKGIDFHTNFYICKKFASRASASHNAKGRYERVKELLVQKKSFLNILFDRANTPNSVFGEEGDEARTLSTAFFYPLKNKVIVYNRNSEENPLKFRL